MKRIISSVLLGVLLLTLVAVPVLAAYYAYLTVEEEDGNDYEELALTCTRNITQLVQYDLITSTGLDTRVLTGEGSPLPHMLAEDRITFTSDLAAYETKTLIFYCGATSLDNFYIIPGYDGYITTLDDPDLEFTYVIELLISGYFDAAVGADKNILYKEDAFKVWISAANTLKVAVLEAGDVEQWSMSYDAFTTGEHTVYVVFDGMQAKLYVDNFITPKDTELLWDAGAFQLTGTADTENIYMDGCRHMTFYASGRFWGFYQIDNSTIGWRSSVDGSTWAVEDTVAVVVGDSLMTAFSVWYRNGYVHVGYCGVKTGDDIVRYRRGAPQTNGTIVWSAGWQVAETLSPGTIAKYVSIAADDDDYPFITYAHEVTNDLTDCTKSSANDGTWTTDGGYPFDIVAGHSGAAIYSYYGNTDDDMYILYSTTSHLYGRYYNGSAWGGGQQISAGTAEQFDCVSDADGNLYVIWGYSTGSSNEVYLRIRYAGGAWSSTTQLTDGGFNYDPTISYNPVSDGIYIFYYKASNSNLYGWALMNDTLVGEYTLGAYSVNPGALTSTPYSDHIGILMYGETAKVDHMYLVYPWDWNDSGNNWTWMENNVMPYGDYFTMAVDGVTQLDYEPADIIEGTTLPDEESDHDGIITWGVNPLGVTTSLSVFVDEDEAGPPLEGTIPGLTPPPDMVGPTGQPGWTAEIPSLVSHPLYPAVNVISDVTGIPAKLIWILGATLLVAAAMLVCFRYAPHQLITVFVGGGLSAFFYSMEIYPFWVIFIFAVMGIAVIIGERSPTVS